MIRRVPIVSTLVVLAAVATMVCLGIWQLHRKEWKEALIARYQTALTSKEIVWHGFGDSANAFHRALFYCGRTSDWSSVAGRSAKDVPGWAHVVRCSAGGPDPRDPPGTVKLPDYVLEPVDVVLGWSADPRLVIWRGGEIDGMVVPRGTPPGRVIANPPLAGLEENALPDPGAVATTPMGHLFYAIQWFAFAMIALVIYALALRKRWRDRG